MMLRVAAAVLVAMFQLPVFGHGVHEPDSAPVVAGSPETAAVTAGPAAMSIDEKPGNLVPLDLRFATETSDTVTLRDALAGRPTVLSILYYRCPNACNLLLTNIAAVLKLYSGAAATAPNVLSVSIDPSETPADAMKARSIAYESIQQPYPPDRWRFLTGSAESIDRLTDAVGFNFVKRGDEFDHPMCLIILSPKGKVVRYILGTDYLPVDLTMSLMEANTGTVQPTVARVLRACFSYDPASHRLVFNVLRVSATVIIAILILFIGFLIISGKRRRAKGTN